MFHIRLKELRNQKGLTQRDFSKVFKVSTGAIAMWETGKRQPDNDMMIKLADYFGVSVDYLLGREKSFAHPDLRPIRTKKFRMLGVTACGDPIEAVEEYETFVEADADINADFCLTCKGDSMIGARIYDGDIVFVRAQEKVENGEIAVVLIDNEVTLKRWYLYGNELILHPENPRHRDLRYTAESPEVRCLGKAVAFMSRL